MKFALVALALAQFNAAGKPAYQAISLTELHCNVADHAQVSSVEFYANVDEIAFFNGRGREVDSCWDTFTVFRDRQSGRIIIGNFTAGQESAAAADAIIDQDGTGSLRVGPGAGGRLVDCTVKVR